MEATQKSKKTKKVVSKKKKATAKSQQQRQQQQQQQQQESEPEQEEMEMDQSRYVGCFASESSFLGKLYCFFCIFVGSSNNFF